MVFAAGHRAALCQPLVTVVTAVTTERSAYSYPMLRLGHSTGRQSESGESFRVFGSDARQKDSLFLHSSLPRE